MRVQYDPDFIKRLKSLNVRIRNDVKKHIALFQKSPTAKELNNHPLRGEYQGLRSINVTSDWRAIYEEVKGSGGETIAYFILIGTHEELYG